MVFETPVSGQSTGTYSGPLLHWAPQPPPMKPKEVPATISVRDKTLRTTNVLLTIPSSSFHQSFPKEALIPDLDSLQKNIALDVF
jgi:hypothetical protein